MDPSLSISNDPHNPPQYSPYPTYPTHNTFVSGAVTAQNHNFFPGPNPYHNNHVFQPQPQSQPLALPPPSTIAPPAYPPYSQMICSAIAALNEPNGSSKLAITRYIERSFDNIPAQPSHGALLTHHLKTLKTSGVVTLVKKSYKLATPCAPPQSVAVAAAAAAAGLEAPRSEILPPTNTRNDLMVVSVSTPGSASGSQPLKRGRGRPPKPKHVPQPQQQPPSDVQSNNVVQSNGQYELPLVIANPTGQVNTPATASVKRRPGRPRKNESAGQYIMPAPFVGTMHVQPFIMKRRGRPPGRRAAGRQRKPKSVSATASVFPFVANGARRRGRPRRVESSNATIVAPEAGAIVAAVAPGVKRGRGRPPKVGGVISSRIVKPKRGRGRPVGRPRKIATSVTAGTQDSGEHKKKLDVFQEKVKAIVDVLKAGVKTEDQAVIRAIQELEGLTVMETIEPQAMEEVQPEETALPQTDAQAESAETQAGEEKQEQGQESGGEGQGPERGGGEAQTQTEAEAMQEALF